MVLARGRGVCTPVNAAQQSTTHVIRKHQKHLHSVISNAPDCVRGVQGLHPAGVQPRPLNASHVGQECLLWV